MANEATVKTALKTRPLILSQDVMQPKLGQEACRVHCACMCVCVCLLVFPLKNTGALLSFSFVFDISSLFFVQ